MGEKILLVDDDPDMASLLQSELENAGYLVKICEAGDEVLGCLHEYKPAILITDVMLPGIDGYSLISHMSDDEVLRDMPVIVMSALTTSRSMFESLPQVKAFFPKPFSPDEFLGAVKSALAK
ncbi:MAG TPA: response regulator [Elusimicrobiales bacterium]|nr:response regulator [Elusimicrobiales bacterium]